MRVLVAVLVMACAAPVLASPGFECGDLVGTWKGERFDHTIGAQRTSVATFYASGIVVLDFVYNDGVATESSREYAHWHCEADVLTLDYTKTMEDGPVDYYEIGELNTSYVAFKDVAADCRNRYGDCGGVHYELVRVPDPPPGDESCGC